MSKEVGTPRYPSSSDPCKGCDEAIHKGVWVTELERAATTSSSLDQSRTVVTSNKTQSKQHIMIKSLGIGSVLSQITGNPTDSQQYTLTTQPSSSRSQKKQSRRTQRKDTTVSQEETQLDDSFPTPSNDPPLSELGPNVGKEKVIKNYKIKKRLRKVGMSRRVESFEDKDNLGDHEDASKQGRSIEDIDKDADVSLVDDTQGRSDDAEMFDTNELHGDEVVMDMPVAKPKVFTIAATTTTTRPKARGVVVQEPSEFRTPQESQPLMIKDKGKAIMIEPEVPLKRKDQVALDEDLERNLQAQLEAELIEEESLARKKEEEANIALIESWDNTQAMMKADFELAQRLKTEEQGEITIEERSRLFVELMNKRKKHFAMLRAEEKRRKPPTKAQKRNLISTYLKNMGRYKHNQLKSKSYEEIQKMFDNEMKRVNTFIPMDSKVDKIKKETEESSKGTEDELKSNKSKKAESNKEKAKGSRKKMLDEHEEVEEDDEAELKKYLVIVKDDDIAIDAIPLATKPPVIVEYKLLKEGIMAHYQLIRADGSSKIYSSMIRMLYDIDREDLETLWKLVKTKHGDIRPEDEHERVLWADLKVMFEPDIKNDVWRNLQGYKVTIWNLYDSCGVHFVRLQKIVSRLAILGVVIAQEDLNSKFLSSLPPEWNTHVFVWMNKPKVDTMSIDDLYNNFKIVEQKVKKSVGASSVSTASPNVNTASPQVSTASFSDNAVYAFMVENPNGSNLLHQDLEQIHEDDLEAMDLKWQLSLLSIRAKRYYQRTGKKIFINANDTAGYDKSKVECFNCHKMGHFSRECRAPRSKEGQFRNQDNTKKQGNNEDTSSKAMLAIDGVGFDWSDMAEEQVQTNMALMAFSDSELDMSYSGLDDFKEPEFKGYGSEVSKKESNVVCDKKLDDFKENSDNSLVKEQVSKDTSSFV
ncbi:putative ribonuclease H-like domain-containing protein [Tanacetum coccineum]